MGKLMIGNTVLFSRGRCNRRGAPLVGIIEDILTPNWAVVVCSRGKFKVRQKDCLALLSYYTGVNDVQGEANDIR